MKGIHILPPSINKSDFNFTVENDSIRFSLLAIKNIGMATVREIVQKRPYNDFTDVCIKVSSKAINRKSIENLIFAGCFDEFQFDRAIFLANIDTIFDYVEIVRPENEEQMDFFLDEDFVPKPSFILVDPLNPVVKLEMEKQVLGTYLSGHPVSQYDKLIKELNGVPLAKLMIDSSQKGYCFVYIKNVRVSKTKKQQQMAFLEIEDMSTSVDAIIFPRSYEKYRQLLHAKEVVAIRGKFDQKDERKQLIIDEVVSIEKLEDQVRQLEYTLFIKIPSDFEKSISFTIQKALTEFKGHTKVILYYEKEKRAVQLSSQYYVNPTISCLEHLKQLVGQENVVLKQ
jgi:DNA polymerase-3 subunit alpha